MNRNLIGAFVGGLIIFIWQFLSFGFINFHRPAQDYTDKEEAIMSFLNSQGLKEGGYVLPNMPEGSTMEEGSKKMAEMKGKPWAIIQYHSQYDTNMVMNMVRGLLVDIAIVFLFIWILGKMNMLTTGTVVTAALFTGLITFLNQPYTGHIWYKSFDIWAHFLDAVVSWGLTGLWLAWWLRRGIDERSRYRVSETQRQVA